MVLRTAAAGPRKEVASTGRSFHMKELALDPPTTVNLDLGSSAWALGICGVLALLIVCITCVVLARTSNGQAPDVIRAFAEVIRAFRRRPRQAGAISAEAGDAAPPLKRSA